MPSHAELYEVALQEYLAENPKVTEEIARAEGSAINAELNSIAAAGTEVGFELAQSNAGTFLDTARGEALSKWVNDRYGISRLGAAAAVGEISISRTITTSALTIAAGTTLQVSGPDGIKIELDQEVSLAAGSAGPVTVDVTTTAAGRDQNVTDATTTLSWTSTPAQSDLVAAWSSSPPLTGGRDEESDAELRARARTWFVNARRATLDALEQGALEVAQVATATAYEHLDAEGTPNGWTTIIIADADGNANGTLTTAVDTALDDWRAAGCPVIVEGGTPINRSISLTVTWKANQATSARKRQVKQAVVAHVNSLRANGAALEAEAPEDTWLDPAHIIEAARRVTGVITATVSDPAGIEKPGHGEMFRTEEGLVTVS